MFGPATLLRGSEPIEGFLLSRNYSSFRPICQASTEPPSNPQPTTWHSLRFLAYWKSAVASSAVRVEGFCEERWLLARGALRLLSW